MILALTFTVGEYSMGNFSDLAQCSRILIFPLNRRQWTLLRVRAGKPESADPSHLQEITNCMKNINHHSLASMILEPLLTNHSALESWVTLGKKILEFFPDIVLQAVGTPCPSVAVCCEHTVLSDPQSSSGSGQCAVISLVGMKRCGQEGNMV